MESNFHFGLKVVVIEQNTELSNSSRRISNWPCYLRYR
jgi:hypothetical protein